MLDLAELANEGRCLRGATHPGGLLQRYCRM